MTAPKQIPAFGGGTIHVTPSMWDHFHVEALKQKAWAERVKDDAAWIAGASTMSKELLANTLKKSADELATYALQYAHHRANLSYGAHNQNAIDPTVRAEWLNLGGTLDERVAFIPQEVPS